MFQEVEDCPLSVKSFAQVKKSVWSKTPQVYEKESHDMKIFIMTRNCTLLK